MGGFVSMICRGMPARMWIPNLRPMEWTYAASGAKPWPPAEEGKRAGAGIYRPKASTVRMAWGLLPSGVGFWTNHSMSTTM